MNASTPNVEASRPQSFGRRILLCVTGLTPQVVTETVYALACAPGDAAWIPTEVHLITTREGAERARLSLLSEQLNGFGRLCSDYQLPPIAFSEQHIHMLKTADGGELPDIRSLDDNEIAADFITERVRAFTADSESALHVSIAGGRKTMGFYLGYALSLFGRPQDKLSHVLVSEPFESTWQFFYPTPYSYVIEARDKQLVDTAHAKVMLAEIPFVSLRHGLPKELLHGQASFSETVKLAQIGLGPPELTLDLAARRVRAHGISFAVPPAELALLAVFARRLLAAESPIAAPPKGVPDPDWAARYLHEFRTIVGPMADRDTTERALANGMDGEYFSSHLSKLNSVLKRQLPAAAFQHYQIAANQRRYALTLPQSAVRFVDAEDWLVTDADPD